MVTEQRKQEANTFLNKKGRIYALQFASFEERKYFDGILYKRGIPLFSKINQICSPSSSILKS